MEPIYLADLIRKADIDRTAFPEFERLRIDAFTVALKVYEERSIGYNVDHPSFQEQVFGPLSLASEVFKRARRLAALLSPLRTDPIRPADINRILDICIDNMNYLSWLYSLVVLATGSAGNENNDDSPDYNKMAGNLNRLGEALIASAESPVRLGPLNLEPDPKA